MRVLYAMLIGCLSTQVMAFCFNEAGARYNLSPQLLKAMAYTESSLNPRALHDNGHSSDMGLMQINTWWLSALRRMGIAKEDLWRPCLNVMTGAWILAQNMTYTSDPWQAVGAYNAGFSEKNQSARTRYIQQVQRNLSRLFP